MNSKGIAGFNVGLVRSVAGGYIPTEWVTGDVITAEKLNKMESGIEDGINKIFIVKINDVFSEDIVIDKTYDEILEAYNNNVPIIVYARTKSDNHPMIYEDIHYQENNNTFVFEHSYSYRFSGTSFTFDYSAISLTNNNTIGQLRYKFTGVSGTVTETYPPQ